MRRNIGPKSLIYPEPVLIIGTYDEKGKANAMTAAWGGISDTNEVCVCLSSDHKTTKNLIKKKAFTISIGTTTYVKECDYLGMVSANDKPDKLEICGFHTYKSKNVDAPIIKELPMTLECELIKYDKKTDHTFAKIKNIVVEDSILTQGKVDIKKLKPLIYDNDTYEYYGVGRKIGNAYSIYKKVKA